MHLLIVLVVSQMTACSLFDRFPANVSAALESAGDNRGELVEVIHHYKASGDSLKLKAAYFLIGNMEDHCFVTYQLVDTNDAIVKLDPLSYPDYDSLLTVVDSIENSRGEFDYERLETTQDLQTITADLLISNIDLAFRAWREKPWAQYMDFEQFCCYVLPYRGSNEPLEEWRSYFLEKYAGVESNMSDSTDPLEIAVIINDDVRTWFGFDARYYYHPTDQGFSEMLESGLGRCEDMTNMAIYAFRANGLPITSDYTPHWANTGNNHAWNAILTEDGRVVPFMGAESNPGKYRLPNRAAKVYRKMFDHQRENLAFQKHRQEKIPRWLGGKNYRDVTSDYVDVCDVTVTFTREVPDSVDIAYLCVFNDGKFRVIHWGSIKQGQATFTAMGQGILYLPVSYENEEIVPLGPPFILDTDCGMTQLDPDSIATTSVRLTGITIRALSASTETVKLVPLNMSKEYELFYWRDSWQLHQSFIADSEEMRITGLPSGGLYWLAEVGSNRKERIFTIEDGRQRFW